MKTKIVCSTRMTERKETEIVRTSKSMRDELDANIQSIITLTGNNNTLRLRLRLAFEEDVNTHGRDVLFLSEDNYKLITGEDNTSEVLISEVEPFRTLTLGADPECFLIMDGSVREAKYVISQLGKHRITNNLGIREKNFGYLGWDGAEKLVEFRPDPVPLSSRDLLIRNLGGLIFHAKKIFSKLPKDTALEAHSFYNKISSGFHIHFGLPDVYIKGFKYIKDDEVAIDPASILKMMKKEHMIFNDLITDALHYYIGIPALFSDSEQKERVWYTKYGRCIEALRMHQFTLEYRIPGGAYMKSPALATSLVAASGLIVSHAVAVLKSITNDYDPTIMENQGLLSEKFYRAFGIANPELLHNIIDMNVRYSKEEEKNLLESIGNNMSKMTGFDEHGKGFILAAVNNKIDSSGSSMFFNWGAET